MTALAENKETGQELLELKTSQIIDPPSQKPQASRPVRTDRSPTDSSPTVISSAVTIIGQVHGPGMIQIDGRIEGDVSGQVVKIGSTAMINGSAGGDNVEVSGALKGKIEARTVVLLKGARVDGEIIYQSLEFGPEARFEGNCRPHFGDVSSNSNSSPPPPHRLR